jgi:multidrug efflux pump subunit AcrB
VPVGFIPMQDQGYLIGLAQLPDGATLQRSDEMRQQMVRLASSVPGVSHTVEFTGFSGLDGTNRSNAVTTFLVLAPFEERKKGPKENGFAILA